MVPRRVGRGFGHGAGVRAGNKFGAQRAASFDGRTFASKAERDRYNELCLLLRAGTITELQLQPRWTFERDGRPLRVGRQALRYTADFSYRDEGGRLIVEDVKGFLTRDAQIRIALMQWHHGIDVVLVGKRR